MLLPFPIRPCENVFPARGPSLLPDHVLGDSPHMGTPHVPQSLLKGTRMWEVLGAGGRNTLAETLN